jgi:hypothetical protein
LGEKALRGGPGLAVTQAAGWKRRANGWSPGVGEVARLTGGPKMAAGGRGLMVGSGVAAVGPAVRWAQVDKRNVQISHNHRNSNLAMKNCW